MKKRLIVLFCGLLVTGSAWSFHKAANRSRYNDEVYGFVIDAPRFPGAGPAVGGTPVYFTGPPVEGFASNVNVLVQAAKTTRKDLRELSLGQFRELDMKVLSERELTVSGREAIEMEYEGAFPGRKKLHFLSLSIIDKDRVIVITGTSTPEAFAAVEPEFRACLGSFRLKDDIRP